ncbi:MAG: hypothetical protein PVJ92_00465 [Candidatus Dependentiae bacterium]|jgi:hypothetical protein
MNKLSLPHTAYLLLLGALLFTPVVARHNGGRFDKLVEKETATEAAPTTPAEAETRQSEPTPTSRTEEAGEMVPDRTTDRSEAPEAAQTDQSDDIDVALPSANELPHTPIGSICSNFARRCSFVADHLMSQSPQRTNQQMLKLFSNVLFLTADLADTDTAGLADGNTIAVRADSYASDLVAIVATIKETVSLDPSLANIVYHYPTLGSLLRTVTHRGMQDTDMARTELGMSVYRLLRAPDSGKIFVSELFRELNDIGQKKADSLVALFHGDLEHLLDLAAQPVDETHLTRSSVQPDAAERKEFRQAALLCRSAANACESVASVVTQDQYLSHSKPLMTQFHALLSAMAVTYDRLGAPHRLVPRADRNVLAHHLAEMIALVPTTRTPHDHQPQMNTLYLDRCNSLDTLEEKEGFVQRQLESRYDRNELLGEFFAVFKDTVDRNITQFSHALTEYTSTVLSQRCWSHLSEHGGE